MIYHRFPDVERFGFFFNSAIVNKIVLVYASTGMYLCSVCTSGFDGETCNSQNVDYYRKTQD